MQFKSINVDGLNIFYREAGNEAAPKARPPARVSGFIAPRRKRGRLIGYAPGRATTTRASRGSLTTLTGWRSWAWGPV
jgi:hypothetical protein